MLPPMVCRVYEWLFRVEGARKISFAVRADARLNMPREANAVIAQSRTRKTTQAAIVTSSES